MTTPASQPTTNRELDGESRERPATLRAEIKRGLADIEARQVRDFDAGRIVKLGKRLSARRSHPE